MATRELSAEYLELLLAMLEAAALASIDTGRFVSQRVAKAAVKPPTWAPQDKKDWAHHVRLKNEQGQTVGFADTNSPVVGHVRDSAADGSGKSAEGKEDLMLVGGGAFAIREPQESGKMAEAILVSEERARQYAEDELGWAWAEDGQGVVDSSKPVVAHGVSADVGHAQQVVAMNAHVHNAESARVFEQHGVVVRTDDFSGGEPVVYSGWDDREQLAGGLYQDSWSDAVATDFDPVMDRVEPAQYEPDTAGWD